MKDFFRKAKRIARTLLNHIEQLYFNISGSRYECNICHNKSNKFNTDGWHLNCVCPYCSSQIRQRLFIAAITSIDKFKLEKIIKGKKVLHFAPEKSIGKVLKQHAKEYKTADYLTEGYSYENIDFNIDISDMASVADESFDCVIACDVLEHVPDHLKGMREAHRILKNDGICIFTVPQQDNLAHTIEDPSIIDPKEREKIFGQFDHLRIYGNDFQNMLQNTGFEVTVIDERNFENEKVKLHVLFPSVLSEHPLATNHRKIFFGEKRR